MRCSGPRGSDGGLSRHGEHVGAGGARWALSCPGHAAPTCGGLRPRKGDSEWESREGACGEGTRGGGSASQLLPQDLQWQTAPGGPRGRPLPHGASASLGDQLTLGQKGCRGLCWRRLDRGPRRKP